MSYTYEDAMKALRAADAAGNVEDGRRIAQIAARLKGQNARPGVMAQVNRGIADAAGGLVDFINPFDEPHALNPCPEGTGSARWVTVASAAEAGLATPMLVTTRVPCSAASGRMASNRRSSQGL